MLTLEWESEGLQTVGIGVIICASLKLLHLLGLIDFSEGKVVAPSVCSWSGFVQNWIQALRKLRLNNQCESFKICVLATEQPSNGLFISVYPDFGRWEGRGLHHYLSV